MRPDRGVPWTGVRTPSSATQKAIRVPHLRTIPLTRLGDVREELEGDRSMRKYRKWVLTLSLLATTPVLTFAADSSSKEGIPSAGSRAARTDNQRVAEDIAGALRGKVKGEINIEYKDGVAILSGSVVDPKVKKLAGSLAEQVGGVSRVDNRIAVVEKKRLFTEKLRKGSSGEVSQASHEASRSDRDSIQPVGAIVPQGAGGVPNSGGMMRSNGTAMMPPVGGSPANPPMQGTVSQNQEVAEQIGAALSEARLDGYDIQIRYQNGVATLDGSVGTQMERAAASRVVSGIPGVNSVANRLACTSEPSAQQAGPAGRGPNAYGPPRGDVRGVGYMQQGGQAQAAPAPGMPMGPGGAPPYPPAYGNPGGGASQAVYNNPSLPDYAWPTYAQYPNSAAVSYPQQYSASAWPYIGPFYPYPQVPLGWRDATLRWDDGQWNLMFKPRTDRWWWFFNPNNW